MIQDKYKVRLHLHEYKFYLKIVALNKWLKQFLSLQCFVYNNNKNLVTILKSPHVNKKAREQFKSVETRLVYFFLNGFNVFKFVSMFTFFNVFFEYFSRFLWYNKQGIFYLR
mgnify:CR=1 FL=1